MPIEALLLLLYSKNAIPSRPTIERMTGALVRSPSVTSVAESTIIPAF